MSNPPSLPATDLRPSIWDSLSQVYKEFKVEDTVKDLRRIVTDENIRRLKLQADYHEFIASDLETALGPDPTPLDKATVESHRSLQRAYSLASEFLTLHLPK